MYFTASNPEQHKCPQVGRFSVTGMVRRDREKRDSDDEIGTDLRGEGCSLEFRSVAVGCGEDETMEFRSHCSSPATNVISGKIYVTIAMHNFLRLKMYIQSIINLLEFGNNLRWKQFLLSLYCFSDYGNLSF